MASPNLYTKRRSSPPSVSPTQPRLKSTGGGFFCKSIMFALFLLALPLFPSQAPDFVGETVLTKFWELIHLLFVGIAVAYGFFSRRNVESGVDLRMSRVDESSLSYLSRIFQVSSVFDEELENSCECVDVRSESLSINVSARDSVVSKEMKLESFVVGSDLEEEELSEYGKVNEVRAWNSQYFQARSKVVVARPAYGLDGHVVHQPLGLPIRSLRSALRDNAASEENSSSETLSDEVTDVVIAASASPVLWCSRPEMVGMGDKSRSSRSSSQTSFESHTQNRFSPSRSVFEESLNSNVEELIKEKSLHGSSSGSSSPSLSPSPPSPDLMTDDTNSRVSHSRHYSDGSLLEEDVRNELEARKVRGRRTDLFGKKERGSKSLNLTTESSRRRGNKPRRSYPPDSISSSIGDTDNATTRRRDLQQTSDDHLFEDNIGIGLESGLKNGLSRESMELSEEDYAKDKKHSESFPALDAIFQPTNAKAVTKNSDTDSVRKKHLVGNNKELKSNSPRCEPQSWRGKSVRTIRSDRHGKDLKTNGDSSDDQTVAEVESRGRTKSRRQQHEELSVVTHKEKVSESCAKSEPEDDVMEETVAEEPQVALKEEEEEEAAWESQSNASHDHNEVDRKAGEFIAKFREQIRLQKLTSGEQPGGTNIIRNSHFR